MSDEHTHDIAEVDTDAFKGAGWMNSALKTDECGVLIYCTGACGWELDLERGCDDFPHYCPDCGARTSVDTEHSTIERENQKSRDV